MEIRINATPEKIAELQNRMQTDQEFLQAIADDPRDALDDYGIEMDDQTAAAIQAHFQSILASGPGPSPVAVAVGVALAVAVAIP